MIRTLAIRTDPRQRYSKATTQESITMPISDLSEVTSETTSEEIAAYADSVAQEVESERQGETKTNAQIINEIAPIEESAENNASSESAEVETQSEKSSNKSSSPKWINDDVKAEAAAYGIEESDISDFANREELNKAFRLLDKTAFKAGRKDLAENDESKTRDEGGKFVKKEESKPNVSKEETPKSGRYELSINKDEYDDGLVDELTKMRDYYESRFETLESRTVEAEHHASEQRLDSLIDTLGFPELFGKTGHETEKNRELRNLLADEVAFRIEKLNSLGRPADMSETLIKIAARTVFPDEHDKRLLKQHTQKISKQSNSRMGGSPVKPIPPSNHPRDEAGRLYEELERA